MFPKRFLIALLAALVPDSGRAQRAASADAWRDTAHHTVRFITVQRGVKLHTLDFGGTGPTLVFLAGLGNTAHAFDDFAPAFTDRFHVIAITRRGFGESSHPTTGYDIPRLAADIKAVLDALHLSRVSIAGHSIAGEEMTRFAATYPSRVDKLVFLDAAYDRVRAATLIATDSAPAPEGELVDVPTAADTISPAAYVAYVHRSRGVNIPEADIRTRYRYDGWQEEANPAYQAIEPETPDYRHVRAPSLGIYAVHDGDDALDAMLRAEFKSRVKSSTVVELHGAHHWIWVSNPADVFSAMRRFLSP